MIMKKKIIIGLGSLFLISRIVNARQKASLGKLTEITPRNLGRVDQYWNSRMDPTLRYLDLMGKIPDSDILNLDEKRASNRFGLYGIEFGNWLNQEERMAHFGAGMQSLKDLSVAIGVTNLNIGQNENLSLAFGARGKGGWAAAHFESNRLVINLTKPNGQGSLAHEYGHFIDRVLCMKYGECQLFASGGRSTRMRTKQNLLNSNSAVGLLESMIDKLYYNDNGSPTNYFLWQTQDSTSDYYRRRTEVFARTFEHYVRIKLRDEGIINNYLVDPIKGQDEPPKNLVNKIMPEMKGLIQLALK